MNELRSIVTVISLLTFIGIVWWAWRPGSKQKVEIVMSDLLTDDDRQPRAASPSRETEK
jgi:cbb3-type cytochrome oxidase subunit 3